ncbi:hypothetical protein F3J40_22815 [Pantoea sp. Acro-835]|uniref:RHS protein conserved region domain-containing protein n=1 Tax=Candidatus Pantoea multigeneris TaxID=2608357 RepID=A0ABX0RHW9_9GAMM|nr:hypothetical protein [Pantoea multigeneris]
MMGLGAFAATCCYIRFTIPRSNIPASPPPPLIPWPMTSLRHWQRLFNRYDPWGNLISRRCGWLEQHYEYDDDNRLIRARGTGPQGRYQAEYHYDALGRRSSKTVTREQCAPETTRFVWQGWRLLQEQFAPHAGYGDRCRTWCYDPDSPWTPLAALGHTGGYPSVQIQYLHCDLNSAPLECTDEQGQLRWSGDYAPFGEVTNPVINSMPMLKNQVHIPLRYAGQYEDRETGLHYNLFRYYDPQVGRFTTPDPIGVLGGFNLYQYVPNPNGWVDPWGLTGKPLNSPLLDKWNEKGGTVWQEIDTRTWVYQDNSGNIVRYPNGYPDFKPYEIQSVDVPDLKGNHRLGPSGDFGKANALAPNGPANLESNTWHHHENGITMQEVPKNIHSNFTHRGGVSKIKKSCQ